MHDAGAYIVNFASILFGLAVGGLLLNINRLLQYRRQVRWHPLPLIAATYILFALLAGWWDLYGVLSGQSTFSISDFLPFYIKLILLFLLAAAVLPSEGDSLDLVTYYFDNRRYFYGLWFIFIIWIIAEPAMFGHPIGWDRLNFMLPRLVGFAVLAWTGRRWVHWLILPLLTASFIFLWFKAQIG